MDRRRFLHHSTLATAGAWLAGVAPVRGAPRVTGAWPLPERFDEVDHFALAHALRDGRQPAPVTPGETADVVVVGGGVAGLTAAYRLGGRRVLVLEKEARCGGNSRSREVDGVRYPLGAFLNQGPIPPFTDFFRETGAEFLPLAPEQHVLRLGDRRVADPLGAGRPKLPWPGAERDALGRAVERLRGLLDPATGIAFPRATNPPEIRALDRHTLWQDYAAQGLPHRVRELFDLLISARIADSGEHLSAWIGNYLLSTVVDRSFTMAGGHGDYSRRLEAALTARQPDALRTGFTVLRVENAGREEVHVTGIDAAGQVQTLAAGCAVIAAPKFFAARVVPGLTAARPDVYSRLHYNAYLVAQVFLREPLALPFETGLAGKRLARFAVASHRLPGNAAPDRGVITLYAPFPRRQGRARLLAADPGALAQRLLDDLLWAYPEVGPAVEDVALHRWGHPMMTAEPGLEEVLARARESHGRIAFGHSDNLGVTGLYSAVWAGMDAAAEAEVILY